MPLFGTRGAASVTGFGGLAKLGYLLRNSLRFRASNSNYLSRTFGSPTNNKVWTWSAWVKRGSLSLADADHLFFASPTDVGGNPSTYARLVFETDGTLRLQSNASAGELFTSSAVFRDPAAWYHIVLYMDAVNTTVRCYINGTEITYASRSNPTNTNTAINGSGNYHRMGFFRTAEPRPFDGYMAEVNFVDGQALTPSSFAKTDGATGQWIPIKYAGTYGNNGFYLPFTGDSFAGSFNGTTQYLQATLPATLTGAFTIESYFYRLGSGNNNLFTLGDSNTSTGLEYYIGSSGTVNNIYSNGAQITSSSNLPTINAWNHVAVTRDSSNGVRLFVNGVQAGSTWTTAAAFSSTLRIGVEFYSSAITGYTNGGLSNFRVVNGTALYTSNFTPPTSALTAVSGTAILTLQNSTIIDNSDNALSITNNGTVVTNTTMLGNQSKDYSPQGNNWTNNNIGVLAGSTLDIMTDVPTLTSATVANYAVMNPLDAQGTATLSDANLTLASSTTAHKNRKATFVIPSTGKWYWELTTASTCSASVILGWGLQTTAAATDSQAGNADTFMAQNDANQDIYNQTTNVFSGGSAVSANAIRQVAYDADTGKLWFGINNVWYSSTDLTSGNPSAGTNQCMTLSAGSYFPTITCYNLTANANYGQQPFAYTPPSGFKSLNTFNLP